MRKDSFHWASYYVGNYRLDSNDFITKIVLHVQVIDS